MIGLDGAPNCGCDVRDRRVDPRRRRFFVWHHGPKTSRARDSHSDLLGNALADNGTIPHACTCVLQGGTDA